MIAFKHGEKNDIFIGARASARCAVVELDVSEERAELERARAQAEEARLNHERTAELRQRGVVSPADFQRSLAQLRVADSEQLLWQTRVDFGRVMAPRRSVVTARYIEPGEAVREQDPLFQLSAMADLIIRLGVSELDVGHLRQGQPATLRLDALPAMTMDAHVRRIAPVADPDSRLVLVEIALPEDAADLGVRPGYLGRVRLSIDSRPEALAVPSAAVGQDGERRYVFVIRENQLHDQDVELGVTRGDWTEILGGLAAGDAVLATNPIDMRDGQAVRIVGWRD